MQLEAGLLLMGKKGSPRESLCDAQLCKNHWVKSKPLTGLAHPFSHARIPQMFHYDNS